ncbi:MAG: hypothetical protein HY364_04465 [Candidatus Aenigmarchaeota archaeon]|nr:hypothetical protein [Candidatus Aenigmarchaeota archaeon]
MDLDRSLFVPLSGRFIRRPPRAEKIMRDAENHGIPVFLDPSDGDPLEFYNSVALWFYARGTLRDFAYDNHSLMLFQGQNYRDSCNMIEGTFSAGQRRVPVIFIPGMHTDRYVGTDVIEDARVYYKNTFKRTPPLTVKIRPAAPYEQPGLYLTDGPHRKILVPPSGLSEAAKRMAYLAGASDIF